MGIQELKTGTKIIKLEAELCGACKMMEPVWKSVQEDYRESKGVEFYNINLDEFPDMATEFEVQSIPTFITLKNGKEVSRKIGTCKKEYLKSMVNDVLMEAQ